jgi:phenylpropionate dioxygenase-like ring-hydroxylating dioxygenase large terminal subunit
MPRRWPEPCSTSRSCCFGPMKESSRRWKTAAVIAACRCPAARCSATTSGANITAWFSIPPASASKFPDRRSFRTTPAFAVSRSPNATIWCGDASLADESRIVRYPWHHAWPYKSKTERIDCNYLLLSDNLLDQTHAAYVHKSTLASNVDAYQRAEMKTVATPDGVKFIRWMLNCIPPGIYSKAVEFKGRVDRWGEFEYVAPSCILQFTGARNVGEGAYEHDARDGGFGLRIFYGITPETEHTSWFIWSTANSYRQNEPAATEELFEEIERAFKEDEDVLVAQYASLRKFGDRPLINIASDGARVQARLALERKIAAERGIPRDQVVTLA